MSLRVSVTPASGSLLQLYAPLSLDIGILRRKLFGSVLLDQYCIFMLCFFTKNKVLTCILMTVAFSHCCAPTVGLGYKY